MDWMLKYVTARNTIAALAFAALFNIYIAMGLRHYPLRWYRHWRYPPQSGPSPEGRAILDANEQQKAAKVEARYRRLRARLDQARAEGFSVEGLQKKAEAALQLNVPNYRRHAVQILVDVEMAIPRRRTRYIPLGPMTAPGEEVEPLLKTP